MHRSRFISFVVWHILLSFYNLSDPVIPVRTERKDDFKYSPEMIAELNKHGINSAALAKDNRHVHRQAHWLCANCQNPESDLREKFKSCAKCKAIQRNVMYCSR